MITNRLVSVVLNGRNFSKKNMIDGTQTFVIYFIVGHHFVVTIHDATGFGQDPEFRSKIFFLTYKCFLDSVFWKRARP